MSQWKYVSGGVTDWYQSTGYRELGIYLVFYGVCTSMDEVVPVGDSPGPNNSYRNVNTITNGNGMPRMRTISRNNIPRIKFNKWEEFAKELMRQTADYGTQSLDRG
ncbi:hypothetical protein Tco_0464285 [Tanacetum coccineum]